MPQDPARQLMYGHCLSVTRRRLQGLRLELLTAMVPTGRYLPAFLFPPPVQPWGVLTDQLAQVAATPPATVRAELDKVRESRPLPAALAPLYDDAAGHLPEVVEELARYWRAAVEPVWQRVRAPCTTDLSFTDELLLVDKPHHCSHRFDLAGTGIVLVPCAFTWPSLGVDRCGAEQPALVYPPRGVAALLDAVRSDQATG